MGIENITLGGGCFWCTEAVLKRIDGVLSVTSGYAGGTKANPTYEEVCTGETGHAEVIQVTYDPAKLGYDDILDVFWQAHDPTTLNRQGADVGTQYRSVVFWHDPGQRATAQQVIAELEKERVFDRPIVTQVVPYSGFYPAEGYHQDYYDRNREQPYCQLVISPKITKLRKLYAARLKAVAK